MTTNPLVWIVCASLLWLSGCSQKVEATNGPTAPPPAKIEVESDSNMVRPPHPEQFPTVIATAHVAANSVEVTGVVAPDISRTTPVVSLVSGRAAEVRARLGDTVDKGQLLLRVYSSDASAAFSDYRKAVQTESLARIQLERAGTLFSKGAIAKKDVEVAQTTEDNARVDVETTEERLRVLGLDPKKPSATVDIFAPVSGVITDQQVTAGSGVQALTAPNPFTISDLSTVWVVCDVFENELAKVHVGDSADVKLAAYPRQVFQAKVSNIGPVLDATNRTAKVRLEIQNPGQFRVGMFVTATIKGQSSGTVASVPASAVVHLHDKDWVYVATKEGTFQRVEVRGGEMLTGGQQAVSGLRPGERVASNALMLQNSTEQ